MHQTPTKLQYTPKPVRSLSHSQKRFRLAYRRAVAEEEAPSGMLARGHYTAVSTFVDDDQNKHLEFEWAFDIAKDW